MTTISRKFLFLFFLSCIFPLALLYGETPGTVKNSFSISVETGISGGKTDEIVNENGNLLSLLEWQEALNPFIHTTFGWEYFFKAPEKGPSFFAELGLKAVLPVISGFFLPALIFPLETLSYQEPWDFSTGQSFSGGLTDTHNTRLTGKPGLETRIKNMFPVQY